MSRPWNTPGKAAGPLRDYGRFFRISGNTAYTTDIHGSVAQQLRKNMAKRNWRKAFNATAAIRQMQMLRLSSSNRAIPPREKAAFPV